MARSRTAPPAVAAARTLCYVDAGHGYALLCDDAGNTTRLSEGGGSPIGMLDDPDYASVQIPLPHRGGVLVVSDGIVEQFGPTTADTRQFGIESAQDVLASKPGDVIESLFAALIRHATSSHLSDDATAVWAWW